MVLVSLVLTTIFFPCLSRGPLLLKNTMLSGELLLKILRGQGGREVGPGARELGNSPIVRLLSKWVPLSRLLSALLPGCKLDAPAFETLGWDHMQSSSNDLGLCPKTQESLVVTEVTWGWLRTG